MPGYAAVFMAMVMTAIGLPLMAVFISEFLALRGAFEANVYWAAWGTLGIVLNAAYLLWLYQRMFFGTIDNPKNEKLSDLSGREWLYMTPLVVLSLWIGCYPRTFMDYITMPVNVVVRQVRPTYPIPDMPAAAAPRQANIKTNPQGVITIQK
jgi:NADH-quinone oxidoreductase subunit M